MARHHRANIIVCTGAETVPGPIDIIGVVCEAEVIITKGANTVCKLPAGNNSIEIRSASGLGVSAACTLILRVSRHD